MKHVIRLTLFALLPILAACHSSASGHASASMALKIYDVSPAKTRALSAALGRVLGKDGC